MIKKYKNYALLGILGIFILLLNTIPTLAESNVKVTTITNGVITNGADVYVEYGVNHGQYLGTTPLLVDPTLYGGVVYLKFVEPGFKDGHFAVYSYMARYPYISVYLNPLS